MGRAPANPNRFGQPGQDLGQAVLADKPLRRFWTARVPNGMEGRPGCQTPIVPSPPCLPARQVASTPFLPVSKSPEMRQVRPTLAANPDRLAVPVGAGQIGAMDAVTFFLPDPAATEAMARRFADLVAPGSCLLLSGPIGAGKSHFARAFIRHRLGYAGDIPSPTFTLVQSYDSPDEEIWHADLYRLSHPDEVMELGLDHAFGRAICLIEWPDRLGAMTPPGAVRLTFLQTGEGRDLQVTGADAALREALLHD